MFLYNEHKSYNLLAKRQQLPQEQSIDSEKFIYCLEAVDDLESHNVTEVQENLEQLALQYGVASIYQTCDTIEGLEGSLNDFNIPLSTIGPNLPTIVDLP